LKPLGTIEKHRETSVGGDTRSLSRVAGTWCELKCTFGAFVTFLIERAANSSFLEILRDVAIFEDPTLQADPEFADYVQLNITFNRVERSARVSIWQPLISDIFTIDFVSRSIPNLNDLRIEAQVGSTTIAALGYCLAGQPFPSLEKKLRVKRFQSMENKVPTRGKSKPSSTLTDV
jgi:hypothetical protein